MKYYIKLRENHTNVLFENKKISDIINNRNVAGYQHGTNFS